MAKSKNPPAYEDKIESWVVTEDGQLGQQRVVEPLIGIAHNGVIRIGEATAATPDECRLWARLRRPQDTISNLRATPLVGKLASTLADRMLNRPSFSTLRGMRAPSRRLRMVERSIESGLGRSMMQTIDSQPLPVVASFPVPALIADASGHARVYAIISSVEVERHWVAENARTSRIHYFAPCGKTVSRLKSFGVPDERISLTGLPFPKEILGNEELDILRADLGQRLHHLDPDGRFWPLHGTSVRHFLGKKNCTPAFDRPLTLTFAVGRDGSDLETANSLCRALASRIRADQIRLNLLSELQPTAAAAFQQYRSELCAGSDNVRVVAGDTPEAYFDEFAGVIRTTDILWCPANELSFACGLGIPIIVSPPRDSHEEQNARWLFEIQAAFRQQNPESAESWLLALLHEGHLAEAAWDGFLKARKYGTYKIEEILRTGAMARETSVLRR